MKIVTIVITTWRRPEILNTVLKSLSNQTFSKDRFEIIVVDSNSGDCTPKVVDDASRTLGLDVRLVNAGVNSASAKRNLGFGLAVGRYVIFLDDDCVPDVDHLSKFLDVAEGARGQRIIWCGGVRFDDNLISTSNYYRYRDDCHYSSRKSPLPGKLEFKTIVTMNMLVERDLLIRDSLKFDERFVGYGCEDIEFGYRVESSGYRILPCGADIEHVEPLGDVSKFCKKFFHSGRDGMPAFWSACGAAVNRLGQSSLLEPIQPNDRWQDRVRKRVIHTVLDSRAPRIVRFLLLHTDKLSVFYSKTLYRFVLAGAFREGVRARVQGGGLSIERANKDGWYQ